MTVHAKMIVLSVIAAIVCAALAFADPAPQTRAELKARFEQRHFQLDRLKDQGKMGETFRGFVEAVKDESTLSEDARKLMGEENADRRKLYDLIADEVVKGEKKLSAEKVAERNARRNFAKAKPNEFLKTSDGIWMQRNDINPLKREGQVGEAWDGYVEAVKGAKLNDRQRMVLEAENHIRREIYERKAEKNDSTAKEEAQRAGRKNIDQARSGEYVKGEDGKWKQK